MSFCLSSRFCSVPLFAFVLAAGLSACSAEQAPEGAETTDAASTLDDAGLAVPDASPAGTRQSDAGATLPVEDPSALTTLAEFRGTVDVANGTMELTLLEGSAVTDPGLRRAQQGLCALTIVQDGVPGSGPVNSLELVTGSTGLDSDCDGYFASPLFCGAVTVRSFYLTPYDQVFAQILTLAPSTGFTVQNGDLVPGASSGLGSWAYGDLAASSAAPANAGVRNWVFARSGGNFTFTGRLVANVPELCDGLDNDCDGLTDEGAACTPQGGNCATDADCIIGLVCGAGLCGPSECPAGEHLESGFCISDTRACTVLGGVGSQGWDGAAWATCLPTSCDAGYALRSDSCQRVLCGDGFTEGAEGCDDAGISNGDGCSVVCTIEAGYLCAGQPSLCAPLICNPGYHTVGTTCVRNPVAYVVNQYTSDVSVIDTMTQTVTATIPVGAHPTRVAVNGAGTTAYVTNLDGGSVTVIDTATNTVTSTIPVAQGPTGVALSPTATTAYVTSYPVSQVSVIDTATNAVTASVTVGASPNRIAVNTAGTRAYIADRMLGGVSVLDTATNTVVATISVEDSTSIGPGYTPTADIAVNPAGTLAYALVGGKRFSPNDMFSKIVVIDLATNTVIARVPFGGIAMREEGAIVVNRAGTLVYASNWQGGTVTVFDTATNTVTSTIPVESQPKALSMGTTDATLYVANRASDSVSVIDTATNTVTASVHVGIWPSGIAVFAVPDAAPLGSNCLRNADCYSGYCNTSAPDTSADVCASPICGNGLIEGAEACDDGNLSSADGCTATCLLSACGDGFVQAGVEDCDDSNLLTEECFYGETSCAVCDAGCMLVSGETDFCGDGVVDAAEVCDDGNTIDGDSCSNSCVCGLDFHLQEGVCISDTRGCSPQPAGVTEGTQTWNGGSWDTCVATACGGGFHLLIDACVRNPVAYVVNSNGRSVSVIDTTTQLVTATVAVGGYPNEVAVNGNGTSAYVTNTNDSTVSVIDTGTNAVTNTIPVGANPRGIAASPTDGRVFVANSNDSSVSVIDAATHTVTATIPVAAGPWRITMNPNGSAAYVSNYSGGISVIDTATNTVTTPAALLRASAIALDGTGAVAFALLPPDMPGGMDSPANQWKIALIDTATNTVIRNIFTGTDQMMAASAIAVNAAGSKIYTSSWGTGAVSVLDAATGTVTATIPVGAAPSSLALNSAGTVLVVSNQFSSNASVIDTASSTVVATVVVGLEPIGVAVFSLPTPGPLGATCTISAECASGFCATGPEGSANDRCAPQGMNYLPPATYGMGSPDTELGHQSSETLHAVTLTRGFFIGTTEVTQGQWKALSGGVNAACYQDETSASCSLGNSNDNGPVEMVDWYAAAAFANTRSAAEGLTACYNLQGCADPIDGWKDGAHTGCTGATFAGVSCEGYRLPTESESQYAVRGGTTTATFGGNLNTDVGCVTVSGAGSILSGTALSDLGWYNCDAGGRTHAVAGKVANGFGLFDVLGNVWEWTGDWQGLYPSGPVTDPTGPVSGAERVLSGSSWNGHAGITRSAERGSFGSGSRAGDVGFRLVRTAP